MSNVIKCIPNDQYACTECSMTPEILKIHFDEGIIEFKCPNHGEKIYEIEDYFEKELNFLYSSNKCKSLHEDENNVVNHILDYCMRCKKYLCNSCSLNHEHKLSIIKSNEINYKCPTHFNYFTKYCKTSNLHYCSSDIINCSHEIVEINKPEITDLELLKTKIKLIEKNKILENYYIKFLETLIITYEKHPSNYFNCLNITNTSKIIAEDMQLKNKLLNNELFEKINEQKNKMALTKLELLEDKFLNELNIELGLKLKGNEISLYLSEKNIGDHEFKLISKINFKNLEEINLSHNKIKDIDSMKKSNFPKLKKIDLSYNEIFDINVFKELSQKSPDIEYIDLSNNLIKNADVFKEKIFEKIIVINLNNNNIFQKDLDEIRRIYIDHSFYENSKYTLIYKLDKYYNKI